MCSLSRYSHKIFLVRRFYAPSPKLLHYIKTIYVAYNRTSISITIKLTAD